MMRNLPLSGLALSLSLLALPASAQSSSNTQRSSDTRATVLDPVTVSATPEPPATNTHSALSGDDLRAAGLATGDTARLLESIPGVTTYGAGGISSLPVVHGMADDRLRTQVDGMDLMSACPNHMNPALSLIAPADVARISVFAGITPVSVGGDSIGGTIVVESAAPRFAENDERIRIQAQAGAFSRSNGNARGNQASFDIANHWLQLSYRQATARSDNYRAAKDFKLPGFWQMLSERPVAGSEVASSEYGGSDSRRLGFALKLAEHQTLELSASEQTVDFEGFPNQRMDMVASTPMPSDPTRYEIDKGKTANRNRTLNARYTGQFEWGELKGQLFRQQITHHMDMLQTRFIGMLMPMDTEASTLGGLLKGSIELSNIDVLDVGVDFQHYRLDDWWPPIGSGGGMCCNDFWNIRDGQRDRDGLFTEWTRQWTPQWLSLIGLRHDIVRSDTGKASGYNASYSADAIRFNAEDHARTDHHIDLTLLARYTPDAGQTYEAGIARKTRSPNLYERYAWSTNPMAALMNNFVGDGNAYIGNPELKPEVAYTLSLSGDWHDAQQELWGIKLTGYLTHVRDFIDAQRCPIHLGGTCNTLNATATERYVLLQYVNQSARLYGLDLSFTRALGEIERIGHFTGSGSISYVRGENRRTGDNLYHIMPLNARFALAHRLGPWHNRIEVDLVEPKSRVSRVRNEATTPGYSVVNLKTGWRWKQASIDIELANAFNTFYYLPLGGAYVGQGNSMTTNAIPWGMVVPGPARSLNLALSLDF
jgi:iron complex outermembrane receptor protein